AFAGIVRATQALDVAVGEVARRRGIGVSDRRSPHRGSSAGRDRLPTDAWRARRLPRPWEAAHRLDDLFGHVASEIRDDHPGMQRRGAYTLVAQAPVELDGVEHVGGLG